MVAFHWVFCFGHLSDCAAFDACAAGHLQYMKRRVVIGLRQKGAVSVRPWLAVGVGVGVDLRTVR